MESQFDVTVLGAGNAGMAASRLAKEAGHSVAIVESWEVGGTCPLRGCVPKKVLVGAAQVMHQIDLAADHHIAVGPARLNWAHLMARERSFVEGVPQAFEETLKQRDIALFRGAAKFVDAHKIAVGDDIIEGAKIVIASGSKPRPLPIPGAEMLITSEDILEMSTLPNSLIFIGGGVIALEFAHVFARAGTKVTILEATDRLLPRNDPDCVDRVYQECRRIGIDVCTGVKIISLHPERDGTSCVSYELGGETMRLKADKIANGTGRVPIAEELDLAAGNIEADGPRITADEYLRSVSNPDVYIAGDALWSSAQLSPLATYEGTIVGRNIAEGDRHTPDYRGIPSCVFTVPAFASVGLTEDEAKRQELNFDVKVNDMIDWRSSRTHAETVAYSKTFIEQDTDTILGAHIVGHGAEEIIHLIGFAMCHNLKASDLKDFVYAYPTFSSDLKFLL